MAISIFTLHYHLVIKLPSGKLTVCYWKWPFVSLILLVKWWFSISFCKRLPEAETVSGAIFETGSPRQNSPPRNGKWWRDRHPQEYPRGCSEALGRVFCRHHRESKMTRKENTNLNSKHHLEMDVRCFSLFFSGELRRIIPSFLPWGWEFHGISMAVSCSPCWVLYNPPSRRSDESKKVPTPSASVRKMCLKLGPNTC